MKSFQVIKFLQHYNIDYLTEGHSRCTSGWVQLKQCPFCGGDNYHLGINIQEGWANCWKCRGKNIIQVIQKILKCSWSNAYQIHSEYEGRSRKYQSSKNKQKSNKEAPWPIGTTNLKKRHNDYLTNRSFDPKWVESVYNLKATEHIGDYKFRIIAPIYKNGKMISFQGRDVTGKSSLRYKACSKENESEDHKHNLYAIDLVPHNNIIVTEGITDCWRLGPGSVATFGIGFTDYQIHLLKEFKNIFILYDNNKTPQKIATYMGWKLSSINKNHVEILNIDIDDPANMKQEEANYLMKHLCIN